MVSLTEREITADLIEGCRRGEREPFRALYDAYKDKVYSICLYYFHGDRAAAADATQQVFLKLMTTIGQFRGTADFSTWLYRLVANTCLDGARRAKAREARLAKEVVLDTLPGGASQEQDLVRAQRARLVQEALSGLPPNFRLAILLRYFDDLSYEEMARVLRCSMGTVASRLNRAQKLLASKLEVLRNS
ncbi:MAG TPA: sigma-70 family RNA polymerase sigma factor [Bryobacteraceae bacterium]